MKDRTGCFTNHESSGNASCNNPESPCTALRGVPSMAARWAGGPHPGTRLYFQSQSKSLPIGAYKNFFLFCFVLCYLANKKFRRQRKERLFVH